MGDVRICEKVVQTITSCGTSTNYHHISVQLRKNTGLMFFYNNNPFIRYILLYDDTHYILLIIVKIMVLPPMNKQLLIQTIAILQNNNFS